MYAQMADVDGDQQKEIIAVLDPATDDAEESSARELGIWQLVAERWNLVAKTPLPHVADSEMTGLPTLEKIIPGPRGAQILLTNSDNITVTCRYYNRKITCPRSVLHAK
jgi:hypothetical protein